MVLRILLVLLLASVSCAQARQETAPNISFTLVWPVETPPPQSPPQPQQKTESKLNEAVRVRAAQHALETQEKEQRAMREISRRRAVEQPPVAPEKNEYLKYLADKREEEEAKYDPIVAEMRALYKLDEPNVFKQWKASQPPAQEKQPQVAPPAQKEIDFSKFLDACGRRAPKARPKPKPQVEEE